LIFAISQKAAQLSKINIKPEEIECKVEYLDDTDFGVNCNIQRLGDIDDISADQIIERALLGMAERNKKIQEMKEFECINAYRESEVPIFTGKLNFLASKLTDKDVSKRFTRIIELRGLPDLSGAIENGSISLATLLEIRDSAEWHEFRKLMASESLDVEELESAITSLSSKIRRWWDTDTAKVVRVLTVTALSGVLDQLKPGTGILLAAAHGITEKLGVIDKYVIQGIFPKSGAITFIDEKLPSIYEKREES
jgi:hypothetical protein